MKSIFLFWVAASIAITALIIADLVRPAAHGIAITRADVSEAFALWLLLEFMSTVLLLGTL